MSYDLINSNDNTKKMIITVIIRLLNMTFKNDNKCNNPTFKHDKFGWPEFRRQNFEETKY